MLGSRLKFIALTKPILRKVYFILTFLYQGEIASVASRDEVVQMAEDQISKHKRRCPFFPSLFFKVSQIEAVDG